MLNEILDATNYDENIFHCEITGQECSLDNTTVLTKIDSFIILKNIESSTIDINEKIIYTHSKTPIKFYSEIDVPLDLRNVIGRVFSAIDDEDELEQSTAIMSNEGKRLFTGNQLLSMVKYINEYELIRFPKTMFIAMIDNISKTKIVNCDNWNLEYNSIGRKYRLKKILVEKIEKQTYGIKGILWPGFDIAISDCCDKNPEGMGYLFKTEKEFQNINICCNESAVDYCRKNNCLIYYNDFVNNGKLRLLSKYTYSINKKLQNRYLFRSSNF